MTQLSTMPSPEYAVARPETRHRLEGDTMLIHEALARSRQREAEQEARQYRRARSVTAGRRWARLATWAARRARRARAQFT